MLEHKIETCRTRWKRQNSTRKAFRNNCNLKVASCCNLKVSWESDVSFLWQVRKKLRKRNFWMFSFNKFGPQLQNLKVCFFLKPAVVALEKNPWNVGALSGLAISGALRPKNFYRWRCPWYRFANLRLHFQFSNIPVHLRFEIPSSLDVLWQCGNGNSSEHTCIHWAANMLPSQLLFACCKLRTMAGCTHSVWTPESLQNHMKLIQSLT